MDVDTLKNYEESDQTSMKKCEQGRVVKEIENKRKKKKHFILYGFYFHK